MVVDSDGKPTRIGYRVDEETGKKVRISKRKRQGHQQVTTAEKVQPRLKQRYRNEIRDALNKEFDFANVMQIRAWSSVVVNMGVGDAAGTPS